VEGVGFRDHWGLGFRVQGSLGFRVYRVGELEVAHLESGFQARWVRKELEQARADHLEMTRGMPVSLPS